MAWTTDISEDENNRRQDHINTPRTSLGQGLVWSLETEGVGGREWPHRTKRVWMWRLKLDSNLETCQVPEDQREGSRGREEHWRVPLWSSDLRHFLGTWLPVFDSRKAYLVSLEYWPMGLDGGSSLSNTILKTCQPWVWWLSFVLSFGFHQLFLAGFSPRYVSSWNPVSQFNLNLDTNVHLEPFKKKNVNIRITSLKNMSKRPSTSVLCVPSLPQNFVSFLYSLNDQFLMVRSAEMTVTCHSESS